MKTIRLFGVLAQKFGDVHRFAVNSPAEAIRALAVNFAGFEKFLIESDALAYRVISDDTQVGESELQFPASREIHFVPVVRGAGGAEVKLIVGAALIVAGAAITFFSGGSGSPVGAFLIKLGATVMVAGVIQALTPQPKLPNGEPAERPENKPSYFFNGPVNSVAQGQPVAVGYGRLIVGSAVISAGITAEEWAL